MAHLMKFVALTAVLCCSLIPAVTATFWGEWGIVEECPNGESVDGFKLKTESNQGGGDDSALNAIALRCLGDNWIASSKGPWGQWGKEFLCSNGTRITSCQLRVEPKQGSGDDSAANNLNCKCSNGETLYGDGLSWGEWNAWSANCYTGICGIQTRVEAMQGNGDDSALNDVTFSCCQA